MFAGLINSGLNAGWLFTYLGADPYWYGRVQEEVDAVIAKHRSAPNQSATEVLSILSFDDWEAEFPVIDWSLREVIRLQGVGTAFRKNTSDKDVSLGGGRNAKGVRDDRASDGVTPGVIQI